MSTKGASEAIADLCHLPQLHYPAEPSCGQRCALMPVTIREGSVESMSGDQMMNNAHPDTQRLQQLNRMYRTISRCHHHLIRAEDEQMLAQSFCDVMVEEGGYRMAWV